uniref:Uncharacterized protein n=1 Tax=Anguilla anguilla TaxID=7936 RepID=A0A0E9S9W0_ANGAN
MGVKNWEGPFQTKNKKVNSHWVAIFLSKPSGCTASYSVKRKTDWDLQHSGL